MCLRRSLRISESKILLRNSWKGIDGSRINLLMSRSKKLRHLSNRVKKNIRSLKPGLGPICHMGVSRQTSQCPPLALGTSSSTPELCLKSLFLWPKTQNSPWAPLTSSSRQSVKILKTCTLIKNHSITILTRTGSILVNLCANRTKASCKI